MADAREAPPLVRCGGHLSSTPLVREECQECQPRLHPDFPRVRLVMFCTMAWPVPGGEEDWTQRYGSDRAVLDQRLSVARQLNAFLELTRMTSRRRSEVVKVLQWALRVEHKEAAHG